jgi:hypothetical protein
MNIADAAAKIQMMKLSIRCLVFGLLGLLPFIGLPFGFAALWVSGQVREAERDYWNAARPYRLAGVVCASVGTILWAGILILVVGRLLIYGYWGA